MKSLCFHNWGRKGDLHMSRSFVRKIAEKLDVPCFYYHAEDAAILADVPVEHRPRSQHDNKRFAYTTTFSKDGALFLNTWYGAGNRKYCSTEPDDLITYDTLYRLFSDACVSGLGFKLSELGPPASMLPRIKWDAFPAIGTAIDRLNAVPKGKRVFFDTVDCLSGQAQNFPLTPVLRNAAIRRPGTTFFYTWAPPVVRRSLPANCIWTRDIHGIIDGLDLNENAFISTHCQIIVGRNSSSYTFSLCRENLIDRSARFVEFSTLPFPAAMGPWATSHLPLKCSVDQSSATTRNEAVSVVLRAIDSL